MIPDYRNTTRGKAAMANMIRASELAATAKQATLDDYDMDRIIAAWAAVGVRLRPERIVEHMGQLGAHCE